MIQPVREFFRSSSNSDLPANWQTCAPGDRPDLRPQLSNRCNSDSITESIDLASDSASDNDTDRQACTSGSASRKSLLKPRGGYMLTCSAPPVFTASVAAVRPFAAARTAVARMTTFGSFALATSAVAALRQALVASSCTCCTAH